MNVQGNRPVVATTTVTPPAGGQDDPSNGHCCECRPWVWQFALWVLTLLILMSIIGSTQMTVFMVMLVIFVIAIGRLQRMAAQDGNVERQRGQHDQSTPTAVTDRDTRRTLLHYFHLRPPNEVTAESRSLECGTSGSTPVLESEKVDEEGGVPSSCIICFGDFASGEELCRLPCFHLYHAQCIDEWLDGANHDWCPLCKTDVFAAAAAIRPATGTTTTTTTTTNTTTNNNNINNRSTT